MELKPVEMELDPYILGVYESVMRDHWPNPSTQYYCRVCNYKEFKDEKELNRHNSSPEHQVKFMPGRIFMILYQKGFVMFF